MSVPDLSRMRTVTSRQNNLVKDLRKAFAQSEPTPDGYIAIEGLRIIEEAIRSGLRFRALFLSVSGCAQGSRLVPQMADNVEILLLPDEVFSSSVATETPQGVAALVKLKSFDFKEILNDPSKEMTVLATAGIQDPGNLGTIIRSAEAFAVRAVLLGPKTVSHFNPKVVRASAEGFTETILGRRRYLPELQSPNPRVRDMGRRMALNAPIQGGAADILKLAMIKVDAELAASTVECTMVLTVHDELVFDVAEPDVETAGELVRGAMEAAYPGR